MSRTHLIIGITLAALVSSIAKAQDPTKTYTYDELGRLTKVEIENGSQDGEQRVYTYDKADNRQSVVATDDGSSPPPPPPQSCALSPTDWTTTQSGFAYPRVYAPTGGCGFQVKLDFTITVQSGPISAGQVNAVFAAFDDTLEATETAKVIVVYPVSGVVSTSQQIVLRFDWTAPDGNATFGSQGYSLVTINPN